MREAAPPSKPRFGQPSNGCGPCWIALPYEIGRCHIGDGKKGPCPALILEDASWCRGMALKPSLILNVASTSDPEAAFRGLFALELGGNLGRCVTGDEADV